MRPKIICHMLTSVDGRTLGSRWRPEGFAMGDLFERLHDTFESDAWLVGRVTGQEFAKGKAPYEDAGETVARRNHIVDRAAGNWGVVLDAHGKIAWGRSDIGGDPILVVLTEAVSDAHLAGLRREGVSYIFAGGSEIDLTAAVETLRRELGIETLLLEGGGGTNGSFLRAGLVDELSLVVCPVVDGAKGAPALFDSSEEVEGPSAAVRAMELVSHETVDGGALWLRYRLTSG